MKNNSVSNTKGLLKSSILKISKYVYGGLVVNFDLKKTYMYAMAVHKMVNATHASVCFLNHQSGCLLLWQLTRPSLCPELPHPPAHCQDHLLSEYLVLMVLKNISKFFSIL